MVAQPDNQKIQNENQKILWYVSIAPSFLLIAKAFSIALHTCHRFGELLL